MSDIETILLNSKPLCKFLCPAMNEREVFEHCVYFIKSADNKIYIGETNNFEFRVYKHKRFLIGKKHSNWFLQQDFDRHGEDYFTCGVWCYCKEEDRRAEEKKAILSLSKEHYVYNTHRAPKAKREDKDSIVTITIKVKQSIKDRLEKYRNATTNTYGKKPKIYELIEDMLNEGLEYREGVLNSQINVLQTKENR